MIQTLGSAALWLPKFSPSQISGHGSSPIGNQLEKINQQIQSLNGKLDSSSVAIHAAEDDELRQQLFALSGLVDAARLLQSTNPARAGDHLSSAQRLLDTILKGNTQIHFN
ncbi:MAG: hypothetical protein JXA19_02700 [Anaerolineales bacterium]|nr:hypothetical protein [Anaerolineales bacterium]